MATDTQKAREQFDLYTAARDAGHRDYIKKANKCEQFFYGDHWDPAVEQKLKNQKKPVLTINMVFANMLTASGDQISSSADVSFVPTATGNPETAHALTKMFLHIANTNQLRWHEQEVFNSGALTSRGFFDVRIDFSDNMRGEVRIKRAQAKNIIIDPDADSYDPDDWKEVWYTKWVTPNDIKALYPGKDKEAEDLLKREGSKFEIGYDSMDHVMNSFGRNLRLGPRPESMYMRDKNVTRFVRLLQRQYKERKNVPHFVDRMTGDMRVIPDTWDRNRIAFVAETYEMAVIDRTTDILHWCDTVDDIVLMDEPMTAYKHFTYVPYFPVFYEGKTMGLVENLLSPQELLNKTESQELHIVNTSANSGWKLKSGSLQNMEPEELEERGAETGLVLELNNIDDAEKIQPNNVPQGVDRMAHKAASYLKEIVGISDSRRGFDRADVAAKAIRAKQQAGSINLVVPFNNLVRTRHLVARNVLDLVQTYYTEERSISITTNSLEPKTETFTVNQVTPEGDLVNDLTTGEYNVVVTDVPARDTFEDAQFDEVMRMREVGIMVPDAFIIKNSHLKDKAEIVQALSGGEGESEEQQQIEQLEVQKLQLEVAEYEARILKTKAESALTMARAQKETMDGVTPEGDDGAQAEQELLMQREIKLAEIRLKKYEVDEMLKLKRDEMEGNMKLKEDESKRQAALDRIKARREEAAAKTKAKTAAKKDA